MELLKLLVYKLCPYGGCGGGSADGKWWRGLNLNQPAKNFE